MPKIIKVRQKTEKMKERTITSVIIVAVALLLIVFSKYIVYPIALSLLAAMAVYEMLKVMGLERKYSLSVPAYLLALAFPILAFFVNEDSVSGFLLILAAAMFVYMMWIMGVSVFSKGRLAFSKIAEAFISTVYATVSFTSLSLMRYMDPECGVFFVILVFVISWICDVFAFAVGSIIGKHKLIPEISPKKTVEGSIGGVIFSAIFCLVFGLGLDMIVENMSVNYLYLALFGAVLSVVSQLGDLVASLLKREYGAKDYGRIFPGHGGVMDRFDSVLAVSTILLILTIILPPFVMN